MREPLFRNDVPQRTFIETAGHRPQELRFKQPFPKKFAVRRFTNSFKDFDDVIEVELRSRFAAGALALNILPRGLHPA